MSWESRGGRRYYYHAQKVNGRVVKQYLGAGELAQAIASLEGIEREEREENCWRERQERKKMDALDVTVRGFYSDVEAILRTTLIEAGYHQHARGQWRKRRGDT